MDQHQQDCALLQTLLKLFLGECGRPPPYWRSLLLSHSVCNLLLSHGCLLDSGLADQQLCASVRTNAAAQAPPPGLLSYTHRLHK